VLRFHVFITISSVLLSWLDLEVHQVDLRSLAVRLRPAGGEQ
jgi:hypothetical protein